VTLVRSAVYKLSYLLTYLCFPAPGDGCFDCLTLDCCAPVEDCWGTCSAAYVVCHIIQIHNIKLGLNILSGLVHVHTHGFCLRDLLFWNCPTFGSGRQRELLAVIGASFLLPDAICVSCHPTGGVRSLRGTENTDFDL